MRLLRYKYEWLWRLASISILVLCWALPCECQKKLTGYYHSAWSSENGLGSVLEVYQDRNGYLWLTSSSGIFRFDGVRFETVDEVTNGAILSQDVESVLPSRFGGLWFTSKRRRLLLWKDQTVFVFPDRRCTQGRKPGGMWEDQDGSLWIDASSGLAHLHQGICEQLGHESGYPGGFTRGILLDSSGTLWAKDSANELIYRPHGAPSFLHVQPGDGPVVYTSYIHEAPDRSIWISDMKGLRRVWKPGMSSVDSGAQIPVLHGTEFANFTFAADGSIWAATDRGIEHFEHVQDQAVGVSLDPVKGTLFSKKDGLSSNDITNLFLDREGNVWVGTEAGLDRLRRNFFATLDFDYDRTLQLGVAAGEDNSVWVGSRRTPLTHIASDGSATPYADTVQIRSIRRDASGIIWSAGKGTSNLWRITGDGPPVPMPYPGEDTAAAVATDRNGDLWVSTYAPAMLHHVNGIWRNENEAIGRKPGLIGAMAGDSRGNIWFAFGNNLVEWDGREFHHYSFPVALDITTFTIGIHGDHVWLAGGLGILLFRHGNFEPVTWNKEIQPVSISGVVETDDGELWMNTFDGVVKVSKEELARRMNDSSYAMRAQRFDTLDGLPGLANDRYPDPSIVQSGSGRLWFATSRGVAWLDPKLSQKTKNMLAPPVVIESLKSEGKTFQSKTGIELSAHPQGVEIAYTALSLTMPERVRFRYRLEGIDKEWQDPGNRRVAFYTRLPAGTYQFKVIASNNDDVWNEQGVELGFSVKPAFYETWLFRVVVAILGILLVVWIVRMRIAHIQKRLESGHAERMSERERIARELHDTLLQDFQSAILQFHLVGSHLHDEPARAALNRGLDFADDVLAEGRARILQIRTPGDACREISDALSKYGKGMAELWPLTFSMSLVGEPCDIDSATRDEIYQIGHEAICNAFKHSCGTNVHVEISYVLSVFRMVVTDDGAGMDMNLWHHGRPGHLGMIHMRERAQNIRATLELSSHAEVGTSLSLWLKLGKRKRAIAV